MSEVLREQLSALADGELDASELPMLTRQLNQSQDLQQQLGRYFLCRDAVRRDLPPAGAADLCTRVAAALEDEPVHSASQRRSAWPLRMLRPAAGVAVAASVAALAVAVWPTGGGVPQATRTAAEAPVVNSSPLGPAFRVSTGPGDSANAAVEAGEWQRLRPEVQQRLNGYIVDHSGHVTGGQWGGVMNYVRIAGHEPGE